MVNATESRKLEGSEARVDERTLRSNLKELDDAALVAEYLEGRRHAFHELAERYHTRLLNFIYRTIGDRDRAEDLVQETFVRVYRHLHRFDPTKKFSTWIYTIASNLAKNELRNRSRNPLVLFQAIKKNWEADHQAPAVGGQFVFAGRPVPEAAPERAGREGGGGACRSTTGWCSSCARWRARRTRRSQRSPASRSAR